MTPDSVKALAEKILDHTCNFLDIRLGQLRHREDVLRQIESLLREVMVVSYKEGLEHGHADATKDLQDQFHKAEQKAYARAAEVVRNRADFIDETKRFTVDADYLRAIAAAIEKLMEGK
jgi:hypothetical protein